MSSKDSDCQPRRKLTNQSATLKAHVEAQIAAAIEKKVAKARAELAEWPAGLPFRLEMSGPLVLGRILVIGTRADYCVGQDAYIATVVWMSPLMCATVAGLGRYSSQLLHLQHAEDDGRSCDGLSMPASKPRAGRTPGHRYFVDVWRFKPTEAACILETNICARLCDCDDDIVPGYAGFVRWVEDFDPETLSARRTKDSITRFVTLVYRRQRQMHCSVNP